MSARDHNLPDSDLTDSLLAMLHTLHLQPCHHVRTLAALGVDLLEALAGTRDASSLLSDPRFQDPGWRNPLRLRALQAWQVWRQQGATWVEGLDISATDKARLHLLNHYVTEAWSPENGPLNPAVLEEVQRTGGRNFRSGLCNLAKDAMLRRPLPAQTEQDALHVGRDVAATPGQVVLREPMFELIQYQPATAEVVHRPLVIIPPQLNRFYLLDMTPASSLVGHAVDQGLQVFLISWRNPNPSHCEWGFEDYVLAADKAVQTACAISDATQANLLAVCAGGLIGLMLQGYYAARQIDRIVAASYLVTPIDPHLITEATLLAGPRMRRALRNRVWQQGCLSASQLAAGFSWLRPEQLIWPFVMQRYVLGHSAAAHPVKFWNQDCTRLPAQLVDDMLSLFEKDALGHPGRLTIDGVAIDLQKVETPSWHLGALRDHIVPWANCYPAGRLGGEKTFVLCHSGHIQGLVNPPGHPRAWYQSGEAKAPLATDWLDSCARTQGSWWPAWSAWIIKQSGSLQPAPTRLGSIKHPPLDAAPGRYVHQL